MKLSKVQYEQINLLPSQMPHKSREKLTLNYQKVLLKGVIFGNKASKNGR